MEKRNLLYEHQYGFQKKLSTNHALIDITEKNKINIRLKYICMQHGRLTESEAYQINGLKAFFKEDRNTQA